MRILILSAFCLVATPALAFDDPRALIEALYAPYLADESGDMGAVQSVGLNALYDRERAEGDGGICRIDFDPYIDGQDWLLSDLSINSVETLGGTGRVDVTFVNAGAPIHLIYAVVQDADGWKVDDVTGIDADGQPTYSLRGILTLPSCLQDYPSD